MSKYAPADDYGRKPYVVTKWHWSREVSKVVYTADAKEARWTAWGRMGVGEHIVNVRRATPADVQDGAA